MNVFNRILVSVLAAAVIAVAVCILGVIGGLFSPERLGPLAFIVNLFPWATQTTVTALSAAGALVAGVVLLIFELRPGGHGKHVVVRQDELGTVIVDLHGIEELVSREAVRVGGVRDAQSRVGESKEGLRISERITVASDVNMPELSRQLRERIKNAVERYLGQAVAEVRIDAHLERMGVRRPIQPSA